ncbi:MAG: hypothetical protein DDT18_01007 [Actinobacteria bacterium]|nr:hypothetical protein [Actinomycetota bacterium]
MSPEVIHRKKVTLGDFGRVVQEPFHVGYLDPLSSPYGDGFEVFASHDGAGPSSAQLPVGFRSDTGHRYQVLSSRADDEAFDLLILFQTLQFFFRFKDTLAPKPLGILDLELAVFDGDIDRLV